MHCDHTESAHPCTFIIQLEMVLLEYVIVYEMYDNVMTVNNVTERTYCS